MKLSAPSAIIFLLSLVFAIIALLKLYGVHVPQVSLSVRWCFAIAYAILFIGTVSRGL